MTECRPASPSAYQKAIDLLKDGKSVVLPTETVYGLAVLATESAAVETIYALKNRPRDLALSICVFTPEQAHELCEISPLAQRLIDVFWPGPLTLVLPQEQNTNIAGNVNTGMSRLGIRCPDTPWRDVFLSTGFNTPIVLTSANTSGKPSPLDAETVAQDLGDNTSLIIDGGPTRSGVDSTILSIDGDTATLLRAGAISAEDFAPLAIKWRAV